MSRLAKGKTNCVLDKMTSEELCDPEFLADNPMWSMNDRLFGLLLTHTLQKATTAISFGGIIQQQIVLKMKGE